VLLARDLTLGEEETVRLCFIAPEAPGEYRLQPTLVHVGRGAPLEAGDALPLIVGRGAGV
jgi:hypothetical protein